MKLRNKKTGEIVVFGEGIIDLNKIGCKNVYEMIEDGWEDYEEPKEVWHINSLGEAEALAMDDRLTDAEKSFILDSHLEIGNYFETKEEAELAVRKLKAWKRLKDKSFVFKGVNEDDGSIKTGLLKGVKICKSVEFYEDMTLLFGGEE